MMAPSTVPMIPSGSWKKGGSQPPKKSVTTMVLMMKSATYSAKKKKPKRMPEYSVAKPATISESASTMSNGVRLISAVAAMKKMGKAQNCQKKPQPLTRCHSTISVKERLPVRITMPTTDRVSGIS